MEKNIKCRKCGKKGKIGENEIWPKGWSKRMGIITGKITYLCEICKNQL